MKACVFLGPSFPAAEAERYLESVAVFPPVQAGGVRRALHESYTHIGIIDGLFEQVPTVWHKEILFAMSHGAWVYGASSMGALRAAETYPYGMVGIGKIFEAYRTGLFEDDDEVAVVHSAAEDGYRELSTAMANIRFGLKQAAELGLISNRTREILVSAAKARFYADRSWQALLIDARSFSEVSTSELEGLQEWLAAARPNQKRLDAICLLERMASDIKSGLGPFRPNFAFEPTFHWERAEQAFQKSLQVAKAPNH
jgi:hypothetical protein